MPTLPTLTRTIDDYFTNTWYEIRPQAIDNILDANVFTAILKERGMFTPQIGGEYITRTIRYGQASAEWVDKTDTLPQGYTELKTMARWEWRHIVGHAQRNIIDDQKNNGKFKIASLVEDQIMAMKESIETALETAITGAFSATADTTDKNAQGIHNIVPPYTNRTDNTQGNITRSTNDYFICQYKAIDEPEEVNLVANMNTMFNDCTKHIKKPNLILTSQTWFELYSQFAMDMSQIVKEESTRLADLGYDVLHFRGAPMAYLNSTHFDATNKMLFLNTDYIEFVYDPALWFELTGWERVPLQPEYINHNFSACQLITTQPRRHGELYAA